MASAMRKLAGVYHPAAPKPPSGPTPSRRAGGEAVTCRRMRLLSSESLRGRRGDRSLDNGAVFGSGEGLEPGEGTPGPAEKAAEEAGIPFMHITTDYAGEDAGQLQTRIEAFLETI